MSTRIVIIGGGLAAATAADSLRELGHDGSIDLVAAEPHRPYQRPPLSKGYLTGSESLDEVYVHPESWAAGRDIALRTGIAARRVVACPADPGSPADPRGTVNSGAVELDDGTLLPYDRLLLATGAAPRRLNVSGTEAANVYALRTIEDADRLRAEFSEGRRRVVLIGSGWIGLELAAAARAAGNEVTVVSPSRSPLSSALGDEMGSVFQRLHEDHGVRFELGSGVVSIDTGSDGLATGVVTDRGAIPADLVIVGIGAEPRTALAETAGAELAAPEDGGGIIVDASMRTSVPGVFAAGDAANPVHPVLGSRLRSEHWANAIAGGKVAAASMLGREAELDDIPYFYTDQYDLGMEYSGYAPLAKNASLVVRGDVPGREFVAFWISGGRVVAGMNVNVWEVHGTSANQEVQRLIRDRVLVDPERLADESAALGALA